MSFKDMEEEDSSASMNSHTHMSLGKMCGHKVQSDYKTSKTLKNPFRRFHRCPFWKEDDCRYFVWGDPELPSYQKSCVVKLMVERDTLQEKLLNAKKLMAAKSASNKDEIQWLKKQCDGMQGRITELERINGEMMEHSEKLRAAKRASNNDENQWLKKHCDGMQTRIKELERVNGDLVVHYEKLMDARNAASNDEIQWLKKQTEGLQGRISEVERVNGELVAHSMHLNEVYAKEKNKLYNTIGFLMILLYLMVVVVAILFVKVNGGSTGFLMLK